MNIKNIFEHIQLSGFSKKTWLILGKGPSFNDARDADISSYISLALNHAAKELKTDFAHFIDFDAFLDCAQTLRERKTKIIIPFHPHFDFKSSQKNLTHFVAENENLKWFYENELLFTYDLSSSKQRAFQYPLVYGCYFSGEIAVKLLASCGIRSILLAGIDGGTKYAGAFSYLNQKTLLANGHQSFSIQNREIAKTKLKYPDLLIRRFKNRNREFRVFVGSERAQRLAYEVLKYSIQINSIETIDVFDLGEELEKQNIFNFGAKINRTPFSFYRFFIPQICNFKGQAVYLDSDMLVFGDITELFDQLSPSDPLVSVQPTRQRPAQNSVFVVNNELVKWRPSELLEQCQKDPTAYKALLAGLNLPKISRTVPYVWNSLEFLNSDTKLIHYTDMNRQPWVFRWNRHGRIWVKYLNLAIQDGALCYENVLAAAKCRLVRPSLLKEVASQNFLKFVPGFIVKPLMDLKFKAPYKYL